MNLKKLSLLVVSGLMFVIVATTVVKTISKSIYMSEERQIATLSNGKKTDEIISKMVSSYHYVEVEEPKEEVIEEQPVVEETIVEQTQEQPVSATSVNVYTGKLTGYGGDCYGCSGTLACRTASGSSFNLKTDGMYYNDSAFGSVRILSAATNAFPCGTIVSINNGIMPEFTAIVLDTGGSMRSAWASGTVWMDLAFQTSSDPALAQANSTNTTFTILRQGW